jgi:hypothetical protein
MRAPRVNVLGMFKKIQTIINNLGAHATLWQLVLGVVVSSGLAGWASHATESLKLYQPLSWVTAALLGGLIWMLAYAVWSRARLWSINGTINRDFYKSGDRINPMETTFREKRINVSDLVSPIEPFVRGKTFIDCELIGPANIALVETTEGGGGMNHVTFALSAGCKVNALNQMPNVLVFQDCQFLRGKIF